MVDFRDQTFYQYASALDERARVAEALGHHLVALHLRRRAARIRGIVIDYPCRRADAFRTNRVSPPVRVILLHA